jgi:hypothetical protein
VSSGQFRLGNVFGSQFGDQVSLGHALVSAQACCRTTLIGERRYGSFCDHVVRGPEFGHLADHVVGDRRLCQDGVAGCLAHHVARARRDRTFRVVCVRLVGSAREHADRVVADPRRGSFACSLAGHRGSACMHRDG